MKTLMARACFGLGLGVFALACSGSQLPHDQLLDTEATIRSAQQFGAEQQPEAQLHLRLAQEELQRASALAHQGDSERGQRELLRARADADLAIAQARQARARQELQQLLNSEQQSERSQPAAY